MKNLLIVRFVVALGVVGVLAVSSAQASVILTYCESAGTQTTTVAGTTVFDFNSLGGANKYSNVSCFGGLGTIDSLCVVPSDEYGGSQGHSFYAVDSSSVGGSHHVEKTTLTFSRPMSYFGFWWSAGDAANYLDFYSGGTLVASYSTAWLRQQVPEPKTTPGGYYGNPTTNTVLYSGEHVSAKGLDPGEPFAFINFFASAGTTFDKIVLSNSASSGFESDNWTIRQDAYGTVIGDGTTLPGVPVQSMNGTDATNWKAGSVTVDDSGAAVSSAPEPCLWKLFLIAGFVGIVWQRRAIFRLRPSTATAC